MLSNYSGVYAVSEIDITYRSQPDMNRRPSITCAEQAYPILRNAWDENKIDCIEQSKVLLLNRANKILGIYEHSTGGIVGTVVDIRIVFATALKANASSIIIAHNHPSGSLTPSVADRNITARFEQVGRLLEIELLDHLIITRSGCYSLARGAEISPN